MAAFNRILVPIDGSESAEKAVQQAIYLAEACKVEIDFVYVVNLNGAIGGYSISAAVFPDSILEGVIKAGRAILEHALDLVPETVRAKGHCVNGDPSKTILKLAEEVGSDLIIMGSRGLGVIKCALLGSVSQFLIENAKCPVMIVKAHCSIDKESGR